MVKNKTIILICGAITAALLLSYWNIWQFHFIDLDDDLYVFENRHVLQGLSSAGLKWSFGPTNIAYWHPLTWISLMTDIQLFGLHSGMLHLMNLFIHLAASLVLFALLHQATGKPLRSGVVALLFAIHPVNVESVAWISERKNVLSCLLMLLSLYSYITYAHKPRLLGYGATLGLFCLALMAKPSTVAMIALLFLFDYWPLRRWQPQSSTAPSILRLIAEKIPFALVGVLAVYLAILSTAPPMIETEQIPMGLRIANALVSYAKYLGILFLPIKLVTFHPYPTSIDPLFEFSAALWLIGITFLAFKYRYKFPYMIVGWLWFVGAMVPTSGILQSGLWPALANRWAYVPFIGVFIVLAWGVADLYELSSAKKSVLLVGTILLGSLMVVTRIQAGYWTNSLSLFQHDVEINNNNYMAHLNLGFALQERKQYQEAMTHYDQALRIKPNFELAHMNLGVILAASGDNQKAEFHYLRAIEINPAALQARINLGNLYLRQGHIDESLHAYSLALNQQPDHPNALNGLGAALVRAGRLQEAQGVFQTLVKLNPGDNTFRQNLARITKALEDQQQKKP